MAERDSRSSGPKLSVGPETGRGWFKWGVIGFALAGVTAMGVAAGWKKEVTARVDKHTWIREIEIESLQKIAESAWRDSVPSDAYGATCSREKRSTRKVPDGQTCHTQDVDRGNGTFERKNVCETRYREEPVYDDKCRYSVDRWKRARALSFSGGLADAPKWPTVELRQAGTCRGCEREGAHREEYVVVLKGPEEAQYNCKKGEAEWRTFQPGKSYPLKVRVLTGGADCDSLKP